jgi:hypothetical protein
MATYFLADPITNAKGGRSAPLAGKEGNKVILQLGSKESPLYSPFGSSKFDSEARPSLEIDTTPEIVTEVRAIEYAVKALIVRDSLKLFKAPLTEAQVEESFHSCLSQRGDYPMKIKVKLGNNTRFWDENGAPISPDTNLRAVSVVGKCILSGVWLMGPRSFGISYTLTDIMPRQAPERPCPFI